MSCYAEPELMTMPCLACGCPGVFTAVAEPGQRKMPHYLVCCGCNRERDDLVFHEEQCRAAA
jgi:hypothetical protein